jgi:hypothetical protein
VDPITIRKKPGPASKTRLDIRERWGDLVPGPDSASVSSEAEGKKRLASPTEAEARKRRPEDSIVLSDSDDSMTESITVQAQTTAGAFLKKGRGRPPTTGQYVGLAKAKRALIETEVRELQLLAERQLLEEEREKREAKACWSREVAAEDEVGAEQDGPRRSVFLRETSDAVDTIIKVAAKSSNLKGTF